MKKNKEQIYNLFMNRVCKDDEVYVNGHELLINVNYKITDPNVEQKEKIIPEKDGLYTESPVLEINNVEEFKEALYEYIEAYMQKECAWTSPDIAERFEDVAIYAMSTIWTDATNQDFTNPIQFLKRYTDFLTQNQWEDLKQEQEAGQICGTRIWKQIANSNSERETPHNYYLFTKNENGGKIFFPSICYGIQNDKAYVCAIHQIYGKDQEEDENLRKIRNAVKGRGVEPLGIATLISFIDECKKRGIKQIIMPDNFIMQYTTKNKIKESFIEWYYSHSEEKLEKAREEKEEKINKNHRGSLNNRLMTMFIVSKYYSTGIKFLEIPGEVSDNLTADIQDFKIGREEKKQEDRRKKARGEER